MTMFSAENRRFCGGCGGGYGEGFGTVMSQLQGYAFSSTSGEANCIGSDLVLVAPLMAEDESRAESLNEGVESSSKDVADIGALDEKDDDGWLQLSIGGSGGGGRSHELKQDLTSDQTSQKNDNGTGLVELELMPTSSSHSQMMTPLAPMPEFRAPRPVMNFAGFSPSYFLQQQQQYHQGSSSSNYFPPHQEINWAFRPIPISIASSSSSSSFSSPSPLMAAAPSASYFARPFQLYAGVDVAPAGPPGVDFRVIQPPRRPHSGIWFMLQASQNQEKEPFLPQISKSYLRIKDGRMTIRLVIKYLVNKLRLENESEVRKRIPFHLIFSPI
ncbi:protein LAX PANICLE 2 [Sesamum alatum]|uniref:Protein LAX PANICLE 2 n=1 Tax=Sesamum alatum TaxID=300844 RepID=A0AAE1XKH0_9LAMI|nr:protein LAX PANICLE 2 [Sesamum alatum]